MRPGVDLKNLCWGDVSTGCDPDGAEYLFCKEERQRPELVLILVTSGKLSQVPMKHQNILVDVLYYCTDFWL